MKKPILFFFLVFINIVYASAQTKSDFSFNMVKITDAPNNGDAPLYGFITGTDKNNEEFYFVMIYPKSLAPVPAINIKYITEGLEKDKMRSVRATLIPYDGIVLIGSYRIVVYQAAGRTSIRRKYVKDPDLDYRANHRIYINRTSEEKGFVPDIFDAVVEMNAKHYDPEKDETVNFRLLQKIPDVIASGYPVVDGEGYFNGLIASPKANETFDVVSMLVLERKLSIMTDDGNNCKYFNLIHKGYQASVCDEPHKDDSIAKATILNKKRRIVAIKHDVNYPFAISLKAGPSAQYINVAGTVSPGFGYFGGLNLHLLPDSGVFSLSIRPKYGVYHYNPRYSYFPPNINQAATQTEYDVTSATRKQLDLQVMAEIRFNRRLDGDNYIGLGYSKIFTQQQSYRLTMPDGSNTSYLIPNDKEGLNAFSLEVGWDLSKIRYAIGTTYMATGPFPRNYSSTVNNNVLTPFTNINPNNFFLTFEIAFRLWGHWRNGIKG